MFQSSMTIEKKESEMKSLLFLCQLDMIVY